MSAERGRIVVSGLIAQYPLGGVAWDYIQYAAGLLRLGFDVFYLEDTRLYPYDPRRRETASDCAANVAYLAAVMRRFGFEDRWAYRCASDQLWYGLDEARLRRVVTSADLLLNVSGSLARPAEYAGARRLAYIDSDPVFTQVKLDRGQEDFRAMVDCHQVHFSFGERHSAGVPATGHDWRPTRQPILIDEWAGGGHAHRHAFTTVMNWSSYRPIEHRGRVYGQKDIELLRFLDLPRRVAPTVMEVALNSAGKVRNAPVGMLEHRGGWRIVDPAVVCPDLDSYRDYVRSSMAEWSVAKNGYVEGRPGWFSCRSACYLAAGRPVVVQDTGLDGVLPLGEGLLTFSDLDQAAAAVEAVVADYERHAEAARQIALDYFDSAKVLTRLVERAVA